MIINFECEVAMPLALTCIEFNFKVPRAGAACTAAVAAPKKKKKTFGPIQLFSISEQQEGNMQTRIHE